MGHNPPQGLTALAPPKEGIQPPFSFAHHTADPGGVATPTGIIFPQVNTAEQAIAALQTANYLPGGLSEALVSKGSWALAPGSTNTCIARSTILAQGNRFWLAPSRLLKIPTSIAKLGGSALPSGPKIGKGLDPRPGIATQDGTACALYRIRADPMASVREPISHRTGRCTKDHSRVHLPSCP